MRGGICQGIDDLLGLLDDRAGPAVCDDERQRIVVFRANVNEMNVEPGRSQSRNRGRALSFVLTLRQSYPFAQQRASACIVASRTPCDWSATVSAVGPAGRVYAPQQFGKPRIRKIHPERTNGGVIGFDCCPVVMVILSLADEKAALGGVTAGATQAKGSPHRCG